MHYYYEICLANVYLEDSYVLAIEEGASTLSFTMDLVLLETHPLYEKPKAGEQYCYRGARILFRETQLILWNKRNALVFTDADDSVDLGNIDTFTIEGCTYHLTGDWSAVSVRCGTLLVDIDAPITQ